MQRPGGAARADAPSVFGKMLKKCRGVRPCSAQGGLHEWTSPALLAQTLQNCRGVRPCSGRGGLHGRTSPALLAKMLQKCRDVRPRSSPRVTNRGFVYVALYTFHALCTLNCITCACAWGGGGLRRASSRSLFRVRGMLCVMLTLGVEKPDSDHHVRGSARIIICTHSHLKMCVCRVSTYKSTCAHASRCVVQ